MSYYYVCRAGGTRSSDSSVYEISDSNAYEMLVGSGLYSDLIIVSVTALY